MNISKVNLEFLYNLQLNRSRESRLKNFVGYGYPTHFIGPSVGGADADALWVPRYSPPCCAAAFTYLSHSRRVFFTEVFCSLRLRIGFYLSLVWMKNGHLLGLRVSLKDHAGCMLVHLSGGLVALIGALFLGRRLILLMDISSQSIGPSSGNFALMGYILIFIGLLGYSLPTPAFEFEHIPLNYLGIVVLNNILTLSGGLITIISLLLCIRGRNFDYWHILKCLQGGIAAVIVISGGVDVYKPIIALVLSILGSLWYYLCLYVMEKTFIEDVGNEICIHFLCGILGILLPPIAGSRDNFGKLSEINFANFLWQVICGITIILVIGVTFSLLFYLSSVCNFLRNIHEHKNNERALMQHKNDVVEKTSLGRLFPFDENTDYFQPTQGGNAALSENRNEENMQFSFA